MNNADEDKLETLLRKVTSPLSSTLEAFGTKLDNHRTEMAANVAEIKTDIRYLKENQKEAWEQIDKVRDKWPVVEQLLRKDEITSSIKLNKTSVPPTSPAGQPVMKLGTISSWCIRLAPIILAAALGLIGLGVYFASGSTDEATATMRAIRAIADTNTKISGELKKIQTEIDDAGVQR
jgi:hypothetical protein